MKPKVSMILTTRNRPQYLRRALQSMIDDIYDNRELIVVDDFSDEDTRGLVSTFDEVRLIRTDHHVGVGYARNLGIREATGAWITFLDDDDVGYPNKTSDLVDTALDTGSAFVFGRTVKKFVDSPEHRDVLIPEEGFADDRGVRWIDPADFILRMPSHNNGVLLERDAVLAAGGYQADVHYFDDWAGWLKMFAMGVRPVFVPRDVAEFRFTGNGLTGAIRDNGGLQTALLAMFRRVLTWYRDDTRLRTIIMKLMTGIAGQSFTDYDDYVAFIIENHEELMMPEPRLWSGMAGLTLRDRVHDHMSVSADTVREEMVDPPEHAPDNEIAIDRVGIVDQKVYVTIENTEEGRRSLFGTIDAGIDLPASYRGIHMSRIASLIDTLSERPWNDPLQFVEALKMAIADKQRGSRVYLDLTLNVPVRFRLPESQRSYRQLFMYRFGVDSDRYYSGLVVAHMTACPCVQCYSDCLNDHGDSFVPRKITHSQRSISTIKMWAKDRISLALCDPLRMALDSLVVVTDMLRREDEFNIVYSAHMKPQFIEDCVRGLAAEVRKHVLFQELDEVIIESRSLESIHTRDISARLTLRPEKSGGTTQ